MTRRRASHLAAAGLLLALTVGCGGPPERRLTSGKAVEAELAAGAVHRYRFESPRRAVVEVTAAPFDFDLELVAFDRAGSPRGLADWEGVGEEERLTLAAEAGDLYRLEVRNLAPTSGRYRLYVALGAEPTAKDLLRDEADRAFAEAGELASLEDREAGRRALDRYLVALEAARRLGDVGRQAEIHQQLGRLYRKTLEDHRRAAEHYESAIELLAVLGNDERRANLLAVVGWSYFQLGDVDRAMERWSQALPIKQDLGDRAGEAAVVCNLAQGRRYLGEVQRALDSYDRCVELLTAVGERARSQLGVAYNNRARVYMVLGETDQALSDLHAALAVAAAIDDRELEAIVRTAIGKVHHRDGDLDLALSELDRSVRLREEVGRDHGRAVTLAALGEVQAARGERERALGALGQALDIFRGLDEPRGQAGALAALARAHLDEGDPRLAFEQSGEALEISRLLGDPAGQIEALLAMTEAERHRDRLSEALALSLEGLPLIEEVRRRAVSPDLKAAYFAAVRQHFDLHVELLMELSRRDPAAGYELLALEASETFRARSVLDLLADQRQELAEKADLRFKAERQRLAERILLLHQELEASESAPSGDRLAAIERRLDELLRRYGTLTGEIAPTPELLSATEIQELVGPDSALLEYYLGAERSYLWVVARGAVEVYELASRTEIEALARAAHGLLRDSYRLESPEEGPRDLEELADLVLPRALGVLAARRLVIAADGALHYIPFVSLPWPAGGGALLDRHEVVMVPSASAMAALRRGRRDRLPAPGTLAVIGDPVFGPTDPRLGAEPELHRLRYADAEARAALALVEPEDSWQALGFEATREAMMSPELGRFSILHVVTHGRIDSERPELSRLVFSQVDRDGAEREGALYAFEIPQLELSADLVVLSACETALGEEIRGEGLVGLTQGFFRAGARQVLVSLWPVDDRATAELMERFYIGLLRDGLPPEAALAGAQRSLRGGEGSRRWPPYFWAGFVLQGDSSADPR